MVPQYLNVAQTQSETHQASFNWSGETVPVMEYRGGGAGWWEEGRDQGIGGVGDGLPAD